jgi:hypothetical protein
MQRRDFLRTVGAASIAPAAVDAPTGGDTPSPAATVLYDDRVVSLDHTGADPGATSQHCGYKNVTWS